MMSYHYNRQKKKKRIIYFILSVFVFLALFTPFYSYIYDIFERPFKSAYLNTEELKKDSKNLFFTWFSKKKLIEENENLEKKNSTLNIDILRTEYLESLLEKATYIINLNPNISMSSVIRKNNSGTIMILGGEDSFFSLEDAVINYDGTLIGEISSVFDKTSQVDLLIKNNKKTFGILFPQNISIEMNGNGNALVSELSRDIELEIGDIIYSQNEPGYIIGTVSAIDFDPRDPVKQVYISPMNSIQSLQEVGIIKTTTE